MATKTVKNRLRINQTKEMTLKQLYDEHMEYSKARNFRPQTLENVCYIGLRVEDLNFHIDFCIKNLQSIKEDLLTKEGIYIQDFEDIDKKLKN